MACEAQRQKRIERACSTSALTSSRPRIGEFETTRLSPRTAECVLDDITIPLLWDLSPIDPSSFDPTEPPGRPEIDPPRREPLLPAACDRPASRARGFDWHAGCGAAAPPMAVVRLPRWSPDPSRRWRRIRDARTLELVSQVPRSIVQDLFGVARFLDQGSARKFASSSQGAAAESRQSLPLRTLGTSYWPGSIPAWPDARQVPADRLTIPRARCPEKAAGGGRISAAALPRALPHLADSSRFFAGTRLPLRGPRARLNPLDRPGNRLQAGP